MAFLVYFFRDLDRLRRQAEKLRKLFPGAPGAVIVYEFRRGGAVGMVVAPVGDGDDAKVFPRVEAILGEPDETRREFPKEFSYFKRWMVGQGDLDAYLG